MKEFFEKHKQLFKWLIIGIAIFLILIFCTVLASILVTKNYENKIYPGTKIDGIAVGGLTKTQAANLLTAKFKAKFENGFQFNFLNKTNPSLFVLLLNFIAIRCSR